MWVWIGLGLAVLYWYESRKLASGTPGTWPLFASFTASSPSSSKPAAVHESMWRLGLQELACRPDQRSRGGRSAFSETG
jgi:hypothetical protein